MDQKSIEAQIKKNLFFQGQIKKRSKFLKQWRTRWIVITANFLMTFTNKNYYQMTDIVQIKQINSIKSYLQKEDDLTPTTFKIQSAQNTLHFMAQTVAQKWMWIVMMQRLIDFKFSNSTDYKSIQDVKQIGFDSFNNYKRKQRKQNTQKQDQENNGQNYKQSQNYLKVVKMVQLFKSQELENKKLREHIWQLVKNLQQKCSQEQQKSLIKKIQSQNIQNANNQDFQHLQGVIKGMIICKRLENERKKNTLNIINLLIDQCKKQTTLNWVSQLKQLY